MAGPEPTPTAAQRAYQVLTDQAEKVATSNATTADTLRSRADAWGKAIAGLGTTAVGWIGLTKATDVFPIVGRSGVVYAWSTGAALAAMAIAAISLGVRFQRQTRPISMSLNLARMTSKNMVTGEAEILDTKEAKIVAQIYGEFGTLNLPRGAATAQAARAAESANKGDSGPDGDSSSPANSKTSPAVDVDKTPSGNIVEGVGSPRGTGAEPNPNPNPKPRLWLRLKRIWQRTPESEPEPKPEPKPEPQPLPAGSVPDDAYGNVEASELIEAYAGKAITIERNVEAALGENDEAEARAALERLPRAGQIRAEVYATKMRATVAVVCTRIVEVTTGSLTILTIGVFAAGLIAVAFLTDAAADNQGRDKRSLATLTECATAAEKLTERGFVIGTEAGKVQLPASCGTATKEVPPPTERETVIANVASLSELLTSCKNADPTAASCRTIIESIRVQLAQLE
ncbi:hypothetical protein AB0F85_32080 [Nocardia fluminea]|uniref:hypothetical protein n=1 Tax=Nocardia fluminea TaxID=134984 RepID=UPI0033F70FA4